MEKTKILIVEDNRIVAEEIKMKLEHRGYVITAVTSSGEGALDSVDTDPPDAVLMDIRLGEGMNGIETAAELRKLHQFPIIYLTAHADDETISRAKVTQPNGYIIKPFDERELHSAIEIALYKHQMDRQLMESQEWLLTTLKSIGDGVIATDLNGCIKFMNPVAESLTGWPQENALGRPLDEVFQIINENTLQPVESPVSKVLKTGQIIGLANHTLLIRQDGTRIPIKDSGAPILLNGQEKAGVVLVFQDNTQSRESERKTAAALAEKAALVTEVHHRVKNNMQVILSLLQLQSDRIAESSTPDIITDIHSRINTMAMIHDHLYQSEDLANIRISDYVKDLISIQYRTYGVDSNRISLQMEIADIQLPIAVATPLALVINELISNSLKHAFPDERTGAVTIRLKTVNEGILLAFSDNGIGMAPDIDLNSVESFGLYLVRILVEHQLEGKISLDNGEEGTRFTIRFEQSSHAPRRSGSFL
jgi:PAS domain S-box-containing protein